MKSYLLFFLLIFLSTTYAQTTRPNITVFLVDDMGWQDTSVPFWKEKTPLNKRYHTPNMERLANAGMKFTSAYATPVCTPTRVSMLTGMNASRHGVTNWTSPWRDNNTDAKDDRLIRLPASGQSVPGIKHHLCYAFPADPERA
jgi:arylsulfatase A-like enzyme